MQSLIFRSLSDVALKILGETLLVLLNGHFEAVSFALPSHKDEMHWECLIDTFDLDATPSFHEGKSNYDVKDRSVAVFRLRQRVEESGGTLSAKQAEQLLDEPLSASSRRS